MQNRVKVDTEIPKSSQLPQFENDNFKGILDAMNNGVYIVNHQYKIEYANPALLNEFGSLFDDETCHEYIHGLKNVCPWCKNNEVFSGKAVHREWTSAKTGKTYITFDSPYKKSHCEVCKLAILHDVTEIKKLEKDLRNQLNFTETLIDAIPNPLFFKDTNLCYLGCNKAYQEFRGITREELYGKCVTDIAMPENANKLHAMDISLLAGSEPQKYETSLLLKNGTERNVIFHKACFYNLTGEPAGLIGIIQDITELKYAENIIKNHNQELEQRVLERTESIEHINQELLAINLEIDERRREAEKSHIKLQQLSQVVEYSPNSIVVTDFNGVIEYVNPKFCEITGYSYEEAIGQNPRILKSGLQPKEIYSEMWKTVATGAEWHGEFCNRKKNGELYWEHASISSIKDENGKILQYVAIKENITDLKNSEEKLLAFSNLLKEKNAELEEALIIAEKATQAKSEFLANMSHEIRTPLNAIIGFSGLTLNTSLPPRQHDYIGKIHSAGELLLNIINDILDFSKIEAGQLKIEYVPFRLNIIISNAISIVEQKALDKNLKLKIAPISENAACLVGDPHRLSQIILNLLNNAIKFTEDGEIDLAVAILKQEEERIQLKFSIRDTGIGISDEQLKKLFKPFNQADSSTTRKFGGTGLGLSISKQLVELMGGKIWCESVPSQGSIFNFTSWFSICHKNELKQCSYSCSEITLDKEQTFNFGGSRILIVEDNEFNRQLATELLKDTGAILDTAKNGAEAVKIITEGDIRYDIVLMDIQMPVMDGYEATRVIRSDIRFTSLPIIAMTAHAMEGEQKKILAAGIDAHITKPIDARTMLQIIKFFLRNSETTSLKREKSAPINNLIPEIDGIDAIKALECLDGDKDLYLWVLYSFLDNQIEIGNNIESALTAGDLKKAAQHAHTVKGIAGSIGAVKLEEIALRLEKVINLAEPDKNIKAIFTIFTTELERLLNELKNKLPERVEKEASEANTFDRAVVTKILLKLYAYIKGMDGRAEHYLDDYQTELAGLPQINIEQIEKLLHNFDYAGAEEALLKMSKRNGIDLTKD